MRSHSKAWSFFACHLLTKAGRGKGLDPSTPRALLEINIPLWDGLDTLLRPSLGHLLMREKTLFFISLGLIKNISGNEFETETKFTEKSPNS